MGVRKALIEYRGSGRGVRSGQIYFEARVAFAEVSLIDKHFRGW